MRRSLEMAAGLFHLLPALGASMEDPVSSRLEIRSARQCVVDALGLGRVRTAYQEQSVWILARGCDCLDLFSITPATLLQAYR